MLREGGERRRKERKIERKKERKKEGGEGFYKAFSPLVFVDVTSRSWSVVVRSIWGGRERAWESYRNAGTFHAKAWVAASSYVVSESVAAGAPFQKHKGYSPGCLAGLIAGRWTRYTQYPLLKRPGYIFSEGPGPRELSTYLNAVI